jgi:hypothetical protein
MIRPAAAVAFARNAAVIGVADDPSAGHPRTSVFSLDSAARRTFHLQDGIGRSADG